MGKDAEKNAILQKILSNARIIDTIAQQKSATFLLEQVTWAFNTRANQWALAAGGTTRRWPFVTHRVLRINGVPNLPSTALPEQPLKFVIIFILVCELYTIIGAVKWGRID
eukprot:GEMP01079760.1.p2 GENE.GEMP01079760.1~~GEMP01079760.1.p2  ORF type:complete len:111 (-),score=5.89 GEMP01079760.1:14-346(-)